MRGPAIDDLVYKQIARRIAQQIAEAKLLHAYIEFVTQRGVAPAIEIGSHADPIDPAAVPATTALVITGHVTGIGPVVAEIVTRAPVKIDENTASVLHHCGIVIRSKREDEPWLTN